MHSLFIHCASARSCTTAIKTHLDDDKNPDACMLTRSCPPRGNIRILTLQYRVIGLIRTWQAQPCGTYDPICYNNERVITCTMETERSVTSRDLGSVCYVRKGKNQTCRHGTKKRKVNLIVLNDGQANLKPLQDEEKCEAIRGRVP
jgi:hypothetical protein